MTALASVARTFLPAALALAALAADRPAAALLWVAAVGLVAGPVCRAPRRRAWIAPALLAAVAYGVLASADVPRPLPPALFAAATLAVGACCSARWPAALRVALPAVAATAVLLAGLPDLFGAAPAAWAHTNGALGARLLDLSPATWVVEASGLDWMRHASVYAPAGTDWFSDARAPVGPLPFAVVAAVLGAFALATAPTRVATDPGHDAQRLEER